MLSYPEGFNETPITSVMLNVTDDCNLKCYYCFCEHNPSFMSLDTGKQAIRWLIDYNNTKDLSKVKQPINISVNFFGGEPTLRWNIFVVPLIEWIENEYKLTLNGKYSFSYGCTTNGQLLDEEKLKYFCRQHGGTFLLSVDGQRESQNNNRPRRDGKDSFTAIENNIPLILKYQPLITFRSTLTPRNLSHIADDFLYARNAGFVRWFGTPNMEEEWTAEDMRELDSQMKKIAVVMAYDICNSGRCMQYSYITRGLKYILFREDAEKKRYWKRCGIGTTSIGITTDGKLSGCQEHSTLHDENDIFYIGDIYNGINTERHLRLLESFLKKEHSFINGDKDRCNTCQMYDYCELSSCPSRNYIVNKDVRKVNFFNCYWNKILYEMIFDIIRITNLKDKQKLLNWVKSLKEV